VKKTIEDGGTLVPLIFMSDETHLTNFSGDKKAWPLYMTIGNLSTKVRCKPTMQSVVLVALLPIHLKMKKMAESLKELQREWNAKVANRVLEYIFRSLGSAERCKFNALCADGKRRLCHPRISGWIADYPETLEMTKTRNGWCNKCEQAKDKLGQYTGNNPAPRRDHRLYQRWFKEATTQGVANLTLRGIKNEDNFLWHLETLPNPGDLVKPDILHTILLGVLKHCLEWISKFLEKHGKLELFNKVWMSVPSYLEMTRPRKAYEEVIQWQGKEYRTMARWVLSVLAVTLFESTPGQRQPFDNALHCVRSLLEFHHYASYRSHDDQTLRQMEDSLEDFHRYKEVFQAVRAGKVANRAARTLRSELIKQRDIELAEEMSAADRRCLQNEWKEYLNAEVESKLTEEGHFNFPKIHLLTHFVETIRGFGNLHGWSSDIGEKAHQYVKEGWRASNRNGDVNVQIIQHIETRVAFNVRRLKNNAQDVLLSDEEQNSEGEGETLQISDDNLDPAQPQTTLHSAQISKGQTKLARFEDLLRYVKIPEFMEATRRFFNAVRCKKIAESELLTFEIRLYHSIKVWVQEFQTGIWVPQSIRCTIQKPWYSDEPRNDWVWWTTWHERGTQRGALQKAPYGALKGRLPVRLRCIFKMRVMWKESLHDEWLALVELTEPANGGALEDGSLLPRVTRPRTLTKRVVKSTEGVVYRIIPVGAISGAAHCIPLIPISVGIAQEWYVNTHIDKETWNTVWDDRLVSSGRIINGSEYSEEVED
jgi:hypothetical protein